MPWLLTDFFEVTWLLKRQIWATDVEAAASLNSMTNCTCLIWPTGHWEPCNKLGSQSQAKCISGILTRNVLILGDLPIPLYHSSLVDYLQIVHLSRDNYNINIWAKIILQVIFSTIKQLRADVKFMWLQNCMYIYKKTFNKRQSYSSELPFLKTTSLTLLLTDISLP